MIEKIDIKDASIAEEIRKQMAVANISQKGLLEAGKAIVFNPGDILFNKIVIKFLSKSHAELITSVGSYDIPSLVGISMGMKGGALAGLPSSLSVKILCGIPCISAAKAFHRNGKNYIQIELNNSVSWSSIGAFCLYNVIDTISVDGSLEYNSLTDTNLVNGTVG